jgi:hypothetical protein
MRGKSILFAAFTLLTMAAVTQSAVITDNFDMPRNYLTQGVPGTIWDGFYGLGDGNDVGVEAGETVDVLDANITNTPSSGDANVGVLFMQSSNSYWIEASSPDYVKVGPFIYVDITGDFTAIVSPADYQGCYPGPFVQHNSGGIMARVPHLADAGPGEDFVILEIFPIWGRAVGARLVDNGVDDEFPITVINGGCASIPRYIRMRRAGNTFYFSGSNDKITWTPSPEALIVRNDMSSTNQPVLQVGLFHCTFSPNTGYIAFEHFELLATRAPHPKAYAPWPLNNQIRIIEQTPNVHLTWKAGDDTKAVGGHKVYYSTNQSQVQNRTSGVHIVNDPCYVPTDLQLGKKYYWCVDEVKNTGPDAMGNMWTFTVTPSKATNPDPGNGYVDIPVNLAQLKWTPGISAVQQDFYWGTSFGDVNTATIPTVADLAGSADSVPRPGYPADLPLSTYYYWRIDSNCGALGMVKGDVWKFKTEFALHVCDDFDVSHDYSASDVSGTIWDGIVGIGYVDELNANDTNAGRLYAKVRGQWQDNASGFLLYKSFPSSFAAKVQLYDFLGANGTGYTDVHPGLMVRVANLDAGGPGEDWISIEVYNPQWGFGLRTRNTDNDVTTDLGYGSGGFAAERYFMIQRDESVINVLKSFDGITWTPSYPGGGPVVRPDFAGQTLQAGITQSIPGNGSAWSVWDDFCIGRDPIYKAYSPNPPDGGGVDMFSGILSWMPSDSIEQGKNGQKIYLGADPNSLVDVDHIEGPDPKSKRYSHNASKWETLNLGQVYYWRINEYNSTIPQTWQGDLWRFTALDYAIVDGFEKYSSTGFVTVPNPVPPGTLRKTWIDGRFYTTFTPPSIDPNCKKVKNGSLVQLASDPNDGNKTYAHYQSGNITLSGSRSMKLYYDNSGEVAAYVTWDLDLYYTIGGACQLTADGKKYSEARAAIDDAARITQASQESLKLTRKWGSFKLLKISFYGDPNNTWKTGANYENLWAGLADGNDIANPAIVYHSDANALKNKKWQDWYIPLGTGGFKTAKPTLNLNNIARIHIGIGNRESPPASGGGTGFIIIDDIELLAYGVCIPGSVAGDLNDDCTVNYNDLKIMCNEWLTAGVHADIRADGTVNFIDFSILANNWLVGPVLLGE